MQQRRPRSERTASTRNRVDGYLAEPSDDQPLNYSESSALREGDPLAVRNRQLCRKISFAHPTSVVRHRKFGSPTGNWSTSVRRPPRRSSRVVQGVRWRSRDRRAGGGQLVERPGRRDERLEQALLVGDVRLECRRSRRGLCASTGRARRGGRRIRSALDEARLLERSSRFLSRRTRASSLPSGRSGGARGAGGAAPRAARTSRAGDRGSLSRPARGWRGGRRGRACRATRARRRPARGARGATARRSNRCGQSPYWPDSLW